MEQNTKNFDRNIEQKMNEHEVAPPFGMWNRISSELEAVPAAVAAAGPPVAASLIPKRAMTGIIAAALVIGASLITGYLVNNSMHADKAGNGNTAANTVAKTSVAATTKPATANNTNTQTVGVKTTVQPLIAAVVRVKTKPAIATTPVQATIQAAQQVQPTINEPVAAVNISPVVVNSNTDVPTPIEPVAQNVQEPQTYYFPPIDVNTPERPAASAKVVTSKARNGETTVASNTDDDKPARKRFHPKKRQKFTYGNIIR